MIPKINCTICGNRQTVFLYGTDHIRGYVCNDHTDYINYTNVIKIATTGSKYKPLSGDDLCSNFNRAPNNSNYRKGVKNAN
jgi:hypothetical protein